MSFVPSLSGIFRPSGTNPTSLSNLELWLDASYSPSIILNGSNVSEWRDRSGHSRHYYQTNAAYQPIYEATGFNSHPTLYLTADRHFQNNAFSLDSALTIFLVFNTTGNLGEFILIPVTTFNSIYFEAFTGNNAAYQSMTFFKGGSGTGLGFTNANFFSNNHYLTLTYNNGSQITSSYTARLSGTNQTIATTAAVAHNAEISAIGRRSQQGIASFLGHISEIILYSRVLQASEITTIENYLKAKWNL